ncbi:tail fiber domain-containing protein [Chryseobacterium sp. BIGb0232]|uniref:tail fiber domain-containing protein n=1 Tax=Chryseobacterium sp. BIGb0232 TaxID=2940598 RepID=UPI000F48F865|nr:tail fiber domain-containing protein [Chryseobacterium sp. BIGb0232]MCS4301908.1 hypothetical protein [Chryseobacterium sp. BIGb0232]ROS17854.1 endosialidase-like protein [Chryseobacterium nakagawai]
MKLKLLAIIILGSQMAYSQIGVNTNSPQGSFHVDGAKDNPSTGQPTPAQLANDFIVRANGQVGIGTLNPLEKLEVNGSIQINNAASNYGSYLRAQSSEGVQMTLQATNASSSYGRKGVVGTTSADQLQFIYAANPIMYMDNAGFYPNGNNNIDLGKTNFAFSKIYVYDLVTPSDIRFKKNIQNLNYGLEDIMKIRPVSYQLKEGNDPHVHLGFIAQEIEKIIPELVSSTPDNNGYKAVDYIKLIPVLVKGLQDQEKKIQDQQKQIEALKQKIEGIQKI